MAERWVYLNGAFILEKQATIPITDRGFLFGEGIFTTLRVHQANCELLNGHLQRLQRQAEALKFTLPILNVDWIAELIHLNHARQGSWRLKIIVTVKEEKAYRTAGMVLATLSPFDDQSVEPCQLCLFPGAFNSPLAHVKSLAYLDHLYVKSYAQQQGYEDAITTTQQGFLLETSCSNLFWIDQGICWVPDQELPYLKGVFLHSLLSALSLPVQFVKATIQQISLDAHVYTCNALTHMRPVIAIDHECFQRSSQYEALLQKVILQALQVDSFRIFPN